MFFFINLVRYFIEIYKLIKILNKLNSLKYNKMLEIYI